MKTPILMPAEVDGKKPEATMKALRSRFHGLLIPLSLLLCASWSNASKPAEPTPHLKSAKPLNVLFICVDDLRPKEEWMPSPNLDQLASRALVFDRHYAAVPTCSSSRACMLSGRVTPGTLAGRFNEIDDASPAGRSLPGLFRHAGYTTVCLGKISHVPGGRNEKGHPELKNAWDRLSTSPGPWADSRGRCGDNLLHAYAEGVNRSQLKTNKQPAQLCSFPEKGLLPDQLLAQDACRELALLKQEDKPFFLAVGFYKPHLPFVAHASDLAAIPASIPEAPAALEPPPAQVIPSTEIRQYQPPPGHQNDFSGTDGARNRQMIRRAYAACVHASDARIGELLAELKRLGLAESTIVVIWGDHGWQLGELGLVGKHALTEAALRSSLMIAMPGAPAARSQRLISSLDLRPTLAELCSLPNEGPCDGRSFADLWGRRGSSPRVAVFSWWKNEVSIRTAEHRLLLDVERRPYAYDLKSHPAETPAARLQDPKLISELSRLISAP